MFQKIKILIIFLFFCNICKPQSSWHLTPQIECKAQINLASLPFQFTDTINTFFYTPQEFVFVKKLNYGCLVSRNFKKIKFEIGALTDFVTFKYKLKLVSSNGYSFTHNSSNIIRNYRIPLKISILLFGRDSVASGRKYFSKLYFSFGKDIRALRLSNLFKKLRYNSEREEINKKTSYGLNSEFVVSETITSTSVPRHYSNNLGMQFSLYSRKGNNILNISVNYSFYLKGGYLANHIEFMANNRTYYTSDEARVNAIYLSFSKDIGIKNYFKKQKQN